MLDLGFPAADSQRSSKRYPPRRQTLMFSATMPPRSRSLSSRSWSRRMRRSAPGNREPPRASSTASIWSSREDRELSYRLGSRGTGQHARVSSSQGRCRLGLPAARARGPPGRTDSFGSHSEPASRGASGSAAGRDIESSWPQTLRLAESTFPSSSTSSTSVCLRRSRTTFIGPAVRLEEPCAGTVSTIATWQDKETLRSVEKAIGKQLPRFVAEGVEPHIERKTTIRGRKKDPTSASLTVTPP